MYYMDNNCNFSEAKFYLQPFWLLFFKFTFSVAVFTYYV